MNTVRNKANEDPIFLRILGHLKEQHRTQKDLIDFLKIHPNTFNKWKYGTARGYITRIDDIAEYLNVTPGYLLKGNVEGADAEGLTPQETRILCLIRKLREDQKNAVEDLLESMV